MWRLELPEMKAEVVIVALFNFLWCAQLAVYFGNVILVNSELTAINRLQTAIDSY